MTYWKTSYHWKTLPITEDTLKVVRGCLSKHKAHKLFLQKYKSYQSYFSNYKILLTCHKAYAHLLYMSSTGTVLQNNVLTLKLILCEIQLADTVTL